MKRKVAERARNAGLEEDLDLEKSFLVPAPPELEWWDEGLVNGQSYDAISDPANLKIDTPDSIITIYISYSISTCPGRKTHCAISPTCASILWTYGIKSLMP